MCGRFVGFRSRDEPKGIFPIDKAACEAIANYNVPPHRKYLPLPNTKVEIGLLNFTGRWFLFGQKISQLEAG